MSSPATVRGAASPQIPSIEDDDDGNMEIPRRMMQGTLLRLRILYWIIEVLIGNSQGVVHI
jgi:hypothetical protein